MLKRRELLSGVAALAAKKTSTIGLGLGNYGLKKYPTLEAIRIVAQCGYDSIEFAMMEGWSTESGKVPPEECRKIRAALAEHGLALPSLLEQIPIIGSPAEHKAHMEQLKRDAQFGHAVSAGVGGIVPCVQTGPGGKSKDWEAMKNQMADHLRDWAEIGKRMQTVIAFKGHNLNLNDTSEKSLWLVQQVNSPWIRILYDYSHYQAMGEDLGVTMDRLLPYTAMISIKDGKNYVGKPGYERLLPGEGTIDYLDYYKRLMKFGYSGHTVVEVSGQIQAKPGYDPIATAKRCYAYVAPVMAKAGVRRPGHRTSPSRDKA